MNDAFFFDWPCDRRDAHHKHGTCPPDCPSVEMMKTDRSVECNRHDDCPGVAAHPATQIGGGYKRF